MCEYNGVCGCDVSHRLNELKRKLTFNWWMTLTSASFISGDPSEVGLGRSFSFCAFLASLLTAHWYSGTTPVSNEMEYKHQEAFVLKQLVSYDPADRFQLPSVEGQSNLPSAEMTATWQWAVNERIVPLLSIRFQQLVVSQKKRNEMATYIRVSCRLWGTFSNGTLDISAACTCQSRNRCRTCTGTRRSWLYSAGKNLSQQANLSFFTRPDIHYMTYS